MTLVRDHSHRLSLGAFGHSPDHVEGGRAYLPSHFGAAHIASDDEAFGLPGQAGSLPNVPREAVVSASEVFDIGHPGHVNVCDCKALDERQVSVLHTYSPSDAVPLPLCKACIPVDVQAIPRCDVRVSFQDVSGGMVNAGEAA